MILAASIGIQLAEYVSTLIYLYTLLIILYIVIQLLFSLRNVHPSDSRATNPAVGLLRDICEPFLGLFRRFLPSFGGIDFSPLLAIITLEILNSVIVRGLLHG
jgi:YggT family protein